MIATHLAKLALFIPALYKNNMNIMCINTRYIMFRYLIRAFIQGTYTSLKENFAYHFLTELLKCGNSNMNTESKWCNNICLNKLYLMINICFSMWYVVYGIIQGTLWAWISHHLAACNLSGIIIDVFYQPWWRPSSKNYLYLLGDTTPDPVENSNITVYSLLFFFYLFMLGDMLIGGRLLFSICICLVISSCVDYIFIAVGVTRFGITTVVRGNFSRFSDHCGLSLAIKGISLRSSEVVLHLRNIKHFPCWYTVISTRVEIGKTRNCVETRRPQGGVSSYNFEFFQFCRAVCFIINIHKQTF